MPVLVGEFCASGRLEFSKPLGRLRVGYCACTSSLLWASGRLVAGEFGQTRGVVSVPCRRCRCRSICRASDVVLNRCHDAALTVLNWLAQALALALSCRFFLTWVMARWADRSCSVW